MSSVLSAAQNVTSVLRGGGLESHGQDHKRSASDGSFFGFINGAAHPFDDTLGDLNSYHTGGDFERSDDNIQKVSDVKIEPIRSAIATLGKGELSLESLGLTPEENPTIPAPAMMAEPSSHTHSASVGTITTREDTLKVPDMGLAPSSAKEASSENRRQSFDGSTPKRSRRSRHSLIGRKSTDIKPKSPVIDTKLTQGRNSGSFYNKSRPRLSFSDETGAPPALAESQERSNTVSTAVSTVHDSDDSDRPKPRGEHDNGKHLAGFAYANKKRNQDFHKLFRSLPPNDFLLDDFSCALNREILIQGRMYVSERNICFNSNILGWVTNLVISFDEIVGLEKKTTAGLFPNGIVVQTLHARHSFASFISRDTVFEFLMSIWRQTNARTDLTSQNGNDPYHLDVFNETGEDEETDESISDSSETSGFEEYDDSDEEIDDFEDSEDSDMSSDQEFGESARKAKPAEKGPSTSSSDPGATGAAGADGTNTPAETSATAGGAAASKWPVPNLGAETHASTDPEFDYEAAGEKLLVNEIVSAPLGVVANLLFGDNTKWISTFIVDKEKNVDLKTMSGFEGGLSSGNKRVYEYVKPLSGPVGPKQTRCLCTDTIEGWDLDASLSVITSTSTPDVPSGGSFVTKTRYTISWADNNSTRILLTYVIDWSAKSWFKSPIEKGTQDGQMSFAKNLIAELNATIKKGPTTGKSSTKASFASTATKKTKKGGKKKKKSISSGSSQSSGADKNKEPTTAIRKLVDLLVSHPISLLPIPVWGIILSCLVIVWTMQALSGGPNNMNGSGGGSEYYSRIGTMSKEKLDLIRLEEEYNIWHWIDERAGRGRLGGENTDDKKPRSQLSTPLFDKSLYLEQDLREAIKLTELRVQELKRALDL